MSQVVGPDGAEMRKFILSLVDWSDVHSVVDVGCGVGYDLYQIGARMKTRASGAVEVERTLPSLIGIDVSNEKINAANADARRDERYSFHTHDFEKQLPYPDNSFDLVYSHNVLECATDKNTLLTELHRILKPGGQIVCAHFDWDSAFYNGIDKELIRKIIHTYADWKQDWMEACDGWMGRRLWGTFKRSNLFVDSKLVTYQIVNTKYEFPYYGFMSTQGYGDMVAKGMISKEEHQSFTKEMELQARTGDYLFCITTFICTAHKSNV